MFRLALGVGAILGLYIFRKQKQDALRAEIVPGSALFVDVREPAARRPRPGEKSEKESFSLAVAVDPCSSSRVQSLQNGDSVVVVGSGIVGLSIAIQVATRGCKVTLIDRLPACGGECTPNSWAWINGNGKSPLAYQRLNMLGMRAWEHILPGNVTWCGALLIARSAPQAWT
ncbi:hypothetical protein T484DRAFT_1797248 [Baffinella frigidus]|nr:hypothetical protein T484DRAFT_1797248 [Cryptophyta sp. CCMP2293]